MFQGEACELVEETKGSAPGSVKSYEDLAKAVGMYKILLVSKNTVTGWLKKRWIYHDVS